MSKIAARVRLCRALSGFFVTDNDTTLQYHNQDVWLPVAVGEGVLEAIEGVGHEGLRCGAMRLLGSPGLTAAKAGDKRFQITDGRLQISDCHSTPWAQSCVAQSEI